MNFQLAQAIELFTISVSGAYQDLTGSHVNGNVTSYEATTVNGVNAGDVFNSYKGCVSDLMDSLVNINAFVGFNTDEPDASAGPGSNQFTFQGLHDGSIKFAIPKPASLSVFAVGLLGLAGFARRRKNFK